MAKTVIKFKTENDIWPVVDAWASKEFFFTRETPVFPKEVQGTRTYKTGSIGDIVFACIKISQDNGDVTIEAWKNPGENSIYSHPILGVVNPGMMAASKGFDSLLMGLGLSPKTYHQQESQVSEPGEKKSARTPLWISKRGWTIGLAVVAGLLILGLMAGLILNTLNSPQKVQIRTDDPFTGTPAFSMITSSIPAYNAVFSPDSKFVVVFSKRELASELSFFEVSTGNSTGITQSTVAFIDNIAYRSDGKRMAIASIHSKDLNLIDPNKPDPVSVISPESYNFSLGQPFRTILFSNSADQLRILTQNGDLEIRSGDTGELIEKQKSKICRIAALSPDGTITACETNNNVIELFGTKTGTLIFDGGGISALKFSTDGKSLAVNGADRLYIWHLDTDSQIAVSDFPGVYSVSTFLYSPKGDRLIVGGTATLPKDHGILAVIDVKQGKTRTLFTDLSGTNPVVSPDLKWIALRNKNNLFQLFDITSLMN